MRILRIIGSVDIRHGGPVEALRQTSTVLTGIGHTITTVSLDLPGSQYLIDLPNLHTLGERSILSRIRFSTKLVPWLKRNAENFDVAIIEGLWNYSSVGAWRALAGRLPYVVFAHGMLDPWFRDRFPIKHLAKVLYWCAAEGRVLRDAAFVLFTAEEEMRLARGGGFPVHQYNERVIAFGTAGVRGNASQQVGGFRAAVPTLGNKKYLLFLGRIHPKKGPELLLRAFGAFAANHPSLDLVFVGPDQIGMVAELMAVAAAAGIAERVHWAGLLSGDRKWGAFRGAEAFVLPSHQENFGIAVAEALSCSTPVLISNKVNIWREIEASGAGLVAPDTEAGTRLLIERFLKISPEGRRDMSLAARECFLRHFEITRATEDLAATLLRATDR